jgi:hypothetical protein
VWQVVVAAYGCVLLVLTVAVVAAARHARCTPRKAREAFPPCIKQAAHLQGSISGVTTKLTISVPDDVAAEAREAVRTGQAASVSGYLVAAVQHYRKSMTLSEWLDQADVDAGGAPSPAAFDHIDAQLGMPSDEPQRAGD